MSATTGFAAIPASRSVVAPGPAARIARWLRARVMGQVEARLREDAGLPPGGTMPAPMLRLPMLGGG